MAAAVAHARGWRKKSSTRGKARCCLHQKPSCEKIKLQKDSVAAKEVQLARQFSCEVPGCGLRGELSCSRLPTLARQALPALIPAYSNCPARLCGHREKFKVCPACSHGALIHQLSEASDTKTTFPRGSAHVEKVRSHLISSLV